MGTTKSKQLIWGNKECIQNLKGCLLGSGHLEERINIGTNRNTGLSKSGYGYTRINWKELTESYVKWRYSGSLSKV
jgi:hypothetical protein